MDTPNFSITLYVLFFLRVIINIPRMTLSDWAWRYLPHTEKRIAKRKELYMKMQMFKTLAEMHVADIEAATPEQPKK